MADIPLTLAYRGQIHDDKSKDQLETTILAALSGIAVGVPYMSLYADSLTVSLVVSDQYKLSQIKAFAENMVDADYTVSELEIRFRK